MATSLRSLLSPKLLSPRSPVGFGKFLDEQPFERFSKASQNLYSPTSPRELQKISVSSLPCNDIQIKITEFSRKQKPLLVKTPEKFEILENGLMESHLYVLGKGSFGTVVMGIYKNQDVAVKVIKMRENEELREKNGINLSHENIIKTIDVIINSNMSYAIIIMECLRSARHLQQILEDDNFNIDRKTILNFSLDITKGLSFCHDRNLVHMDLKPGNILVCADGTCKLCDFGNSYDIEKDALKDYQHRGTIAYTAPEVLLGKNPTVKCDVYSFGVTMWQLISRRMPYEDIQHYEIIVYKVVKFDMRPNTNFKTSNDFLESVYTACWSPNSDKRPNCSEIFDLLRSYL